MKISVIVATYGEMRWEQLGHERAIPSARAQLANGDSYVAVHLPEETPDTLARARNLGAEDASGDWLCFLDADDELGRGYLDAMRNAFASWNGDDGLPRIGDPMPRYRGHPSTGPKFPLILLSPALQYVEHYGRVLPPALPNRGQPMDCLNHCVIGTLVPRDLFLEVGGFRDDLPIYEDWALFLACVRAGATIVDVPDAVYRAHMRDGASRNRPRDATEATATYDRIRAEHRAA